MQRSSFWLTLAGALLLGGDLVHGAEPLPAVADLPVLTGWPDPLVMRDGTPVTTAEQWKSQRRPELQRLFEHYMYGAAPPAPEKVTATTNWSDAKYLNGKATLHDITLSFGPAGTPKVGLLLVLPNGTKTPPPVFVGLNFCGNHTVIADPRVTLPTSWMPAKQPGVVENKATDAGRGTQADVWNVDLIVDSGYGLATAYCGDIDPDRNDFSDGVHAAYLKSGQQQPGPHEWGGIAAWAWGVSRLVDHLVTRPDVNPKQLAAVGHSRLGKTAILAAAFDERIALCIPSQAGCGGTAPSRSTVGESVERINTTFPHWFNDTFPEFNKQTAKLPFDQHCLVAMCAPRPILLSNATEDSWANPAGQFEMLQLAAPVYRLLQAGDLAATTMPEPNQLISSKLGYVIRPGKHAMSRVDWQFFIQFANQQFGASK